MTVCNEDRGSMRHSSSWPDRIPKTVKVRVDPLSRAFTIIPSIHETLHPLLTAAKSNWFEEIVLLDRDSPTSGTAKRRFAEDVNVRSRYDPENSQEFHELRTFVPETPKRATRRKSPTKERTQEEHNGRPKFLRSLSTTEETRNWRDTSAADLSSGKKTRSFTGLEEHLAANKDPPDDPFDSEAKRVTAESSTNREPLHEASNLFLDYSNDVSKVDIPREATQTRESPGASDVTSRDDSTKEISPEVKVSRPRSWEDQRSAEGPDDRSNRFFAPTPTRIIPPHIEIVDYDYIASISPRGGQHACPKCTSGFQADPFRSSAVDKRLAINKGDGGSNSRRTEAPDGEGFGWGERAAKCLIGKVRNGREEGKKYEARKSGSPPTRASDVRKEATLRRHYYPEGGWGYVIVTCSVLVHFLGIGLQFAAPGTWHVTAELKFHHPPLHSAGKSALPGAHPL
ncbi:hypothetical protein KM043_004178 [Ampulex compressa]|nr:hypothetical protein KM043_004178 [Ampulex compressa]